VIAELCIREAVQSLPIASDVKIAEAVLCTDRRYEGLRVYERKADLAVTEGIGEETYRQRRRHVLEHVVRYLYIARKAERTQPTQSHHTFAPPPARSHAHSFLAEIHRDALHTAYSAMATLFIADMRIGATSWPDTHVWSHDTRFKDADEVDRRHLFEAYTHLREGLAFYTEAAQRKLAAETFGESPGGELTGAFVRGSHLILRLGPRFEARDLEALEFEFDDVASGMIGDQDRTREHVYRDIWLPWFGSVTDGLPDFAKYTDLGAACLRVAGTITAGVVIDDPHAAWARSRAHKIIAYRYDFDPLLATPDGRATFQMAVNAHFDDFLARAATHEMSGA
jgi:hypothetical protein